MNEIIELIKLIDPIYIPLLIVIYIQHKSNNKLIDRNEELTDQNAENFGTVSKLTTLMEMLAYGKGGRGNE